MIPYKKMDNESKKGYLGEALVCKILGGIQSDDTYDMLKDLTLDDGTFVEVKTQNRYKLQNEFTINLKGSNQLKKCVEVERLIFVEYGLKNRIRVYDCTNRKYNIRHLGNRRMAGFPIKDMTLLYDKENKTLCDELIRLSNADLRYLV